MAGVTHLVMFKFKATEESATVDNVCRNMLALKDRCVHPKTGQPYIRRSSGGKDNSPEGKQNGFTHAFVMEFETAADRDYYIKEDPTHLEFVQSLTGLIENVQVIDFEPGVL